MQRMEALQQEQAAQARSMKRLLNATTDTMTRVQAEVTAELKAERLRSVAAFDAVTNKFEELAKSQPKDPVTQAEILKAALNNAKKEVAAQKQRFSEALASMPTGTVKSQEEHPISVGVNGLYVVIQPGENKDIPAPFIEEWERRLRTAEWAQKVNQSFQIVNERVPDANDIQALRGHTALWDEDTGAI
jgi:hypothetical protein